MSRNLTVAQFASNKNSYVGLLITTASIVWFYTSFILYCHQNTTVAFFFFKEKTAQSFPWSNSDDTVRHVIARCHFLNALQLKHEISLIKASCVIMEFCSFASVVGGTCGPSPENPNIVHFVDLKIVAVNMRLSKCGLGQHFH